VTEKRKIAQRANNQRFSEYFICIWYLVWYRLLWKITPACQESFYGWSSYQKKTQDQSSSYWNYLTTSTIMRNILKADSSEACLIYARPKDHHSHAQSAKKTGFRHLGRHGTQQSLAAAVHCCALWIRCSKRFERKELNWCVYVVIYIYI
jgi:hypothetical protein